MAINQLNPLRNNKENYYFKRDAPTEGRDRDKARFLKCNITISLLMLSHSKYLEVELKASIISV